MPEDSGCRGHDLGQQCGIICPNHPGQLIGHRNQVQQIGQIHWYGNVPEPWS